MSSQILGCPRKKKNPVLQQMEYKQKTNAESMPPHRCLPFGILGLNPTEMTQRPIILEFLLPPGPLENSLSTWRRWHRLLFPSI